jgi:hypothetical protein
LLKPYLSFFHPGGEEYQPATNLSAGDVVNIASLFLPDFVEKADDKWLKTNEQNPTAILFTEREQTPVLWTAIAGAFRGSPLKIGVSRNRELPLLGM